MARDRLLLGAGVNLVVTVEQRFATSFSGWVTFGDVPDEVPPNWKQSMIVLLTLYPIVMLEELFLNPLLRSLGMAEAIFIGNLLSVATTGFLLIPLALRAFEWWYSRDPTILRAWKSPGPR